MTEISNEYQSNLLVVREFTMVTVSRLYFAGPVIESRIVVLPATPKVSASLSAGTLDPTRDTFRMRRELDILIIGAGPAGLSLGFEMKKRGLSFLILEKGASAGESWRNMPRDLRLVSPWKSNSLPGTEKNAFPRHYQMSRVEFWNYLQDYAERTALPIQMDTTVYGVEKCGDGRFEARTSRGEFSSRFLINATGYFANPFTPEIRGASDTRIPRCHLAGYQNPQHVRSIIGKSSGLILIIGKRLSAGQVIMELGRAGFALALAHRSPIQYGAGPFAWWFLFRVFPWLESIKLTSNGDRAPSNDVRMPGGLARKMIESNEVQTFPEVDRFEEDVVVFADGRRLRPDLVLFATGFRAALNHLAPMDLSICPETGQPAVASMESQSVPGLYFIGLDHARNFQSRFLRGIRKDAAFLAGRLETTLRCTKR